MRTTLTIDDDIIENARYLAQRDGRTMGEVISELARKGLGTPMFVEGPNGFLVLAPRPGGEPVTMELINELGDEYP